MCYAVAMAKLTLISAEAARQALNDITFTTPTQTVPLAQARGRFLAKDVFADQAIPEAPRAAMDGFAVIATDLLQASRVRPVTLAVVGEVFAGSLFHGTLLPGQTVRIPTGGCLPAGADAVEAIEAITFAADGQVCFAGPVEAEKHVVPAGQDVMPGQRILRKGTRLLPSHLAALAATGNSNVLVFAQPRVTVFSSGAEVCPPDVRPSPAQVRDVNQILLGGLAESVGALVTYGGIVPDDVATLHEEVSRAVAASDVVILSAGTSVGIRDFAGTVIAGLPGARTLFHGINIRPGKPTVVAHVAGAHDCLVCGLPGFPVSAAVAFAAFVAPRLLHMQGASNASLWRDSIPATLAGPYQSVLGREDYVRVSVAAGPHPRVATVIPSGPALVTGLLNADGFVLVPAETQSLPAGAPVEVLTLDL